MLMSAKALLDESPNPTGIQIQQALRGNLCRCTGYKKIEQAITRAAEVLEGEA
jgi:carbon-monoxide dehydrogenase small subunit